MTDDPSPHETKKLQQLLKKQTFAAVPFATSGVLFLMKVN
jgi:hypothetical protein